MCQDIGILAVIRSNIIPMLAWVQMMLEDGSCRMLSGGVYLVRENEWESTNGG